MSSWAAWLNGAVTAVLKAATTTTTQTRVEVFQGHWTRLVDVLGTGHRADGADGADGSGNRGDDGDASNDTYVGPDAAAQLVFNLDSMLRYLRAEQDDEQQRRQRRRRRQRVAEDDVHDDDHSDAASPDQDESINGDGTDTHDGDDAGSLQTGPCLEFMLQAHVPGVLVQWALQDDDDVARATAIRLAVLQFFTKLISTVRMPLLPEKGVRAPIERLLRECGRLDKHSPDTERAVLMAWMELCLAILKAVHRQPELLPLIFAGPVPELERPQTAGLGTSADPRFLVVGCLLESLDLEDSIGRLARQGVLTAIELITFDPQLSDYLIHDAMLGAQVAIKLAEHYCFLPPYIGGAFMVGTAALPRLSSQHLASSPTSSPSPRNHVSGHHREENDPGWLWWRYVEFLQFVDSLIEQTADSPLGNDICSAVEQKLLFSVVRDALLKPAEREAVTATWYLAYSLREIRNPRLFRSFLQLLTPTSQESVHAEVLRRIDGLSEPLAIASLALFDTIIGLFDPISIDALTLSVEPGSTEPAMICSSVQLVHDTSARWLSLVTWPTHDQVSPRALADTHPDSFSDLVGMRARAGDVPELDDSIEAVDASVAAARDLSLEEADQLESHEEYLAEAQLLHEKALGQWTAWHTVIELPKPEQTRRANGPLVHVLIESISHLPEMSMDKALLLTSCLTKLANCVWSPALQERLLLTKPSNEPSHPTLFDALDSATKRICQRCQSINSFAEKVHAIHHTLSLDLPAKEESLLLAFIVLNEFTKELAATVMVHNLEPLMDAQLAEKTRTLISPVAPTELP